MITEFGLSGKFIVVAQILPTGYIDIFSKKIMRYLDQVKHIYRIYPDKVDLFFSIPGKVTFDLHYRFNNFYLKMKIFFYKIQISNEI